MIKKYQVTLYCTTGAYRPVACIVNNQQADDTDLSMDKQERKKIQKQGVIKICQKRYWTVADLAKYGYTKYKMRAVDENSSKN
jgi:hypothetical protein